VKNGFDDSIGTGPIEDHPGPSKLPARVVTPGSQPRIQGYDLQEDLVRHYSAAEIHLLTLTGEPPSSEVGRAFEVALAFLAATTVAEAPAHAAGLAQLCGSPASGTLSAGALTLAQQAEQAFEHLDVLRAWLRDGQTDIPSELTSEDPAEARAVSRFRRALPERFAAMPMLSGRPRLREAITAVLLGCGLRHLHQLMTVWILARLPAVSAEAFGVEPGRLDCYPMHLPPFHYVETEGFVGEDPGIDEEGGQARPGIDETRDQARPGIDEARDQARPGIDEARDQARPGIDETRNQARPGIDEARDQAKPGIHVPAGQRDGGEGR
jgi:hypothetical protein